MKKVITAEKGGRYSTLAEAQNEARLCGADVTVRGEWRESLVFDERDNGSVWHGEGARLTGGIRVKYDDTSAVTGEMSERFTYPDKVRVLDLSSYGLTAEDWGEEMYPIGSYHTAKRYDGAGTGVNIEVFSGSVRMYPARYPDSGYLKLDGILDMGECGEFPPQNYWPENVSKRNPRPGTYVIDKETNERIKKWKDPSTAWAFGYFFWDWADSSTPIEVDTKHRAIMPRYVSQYGAHAGALYYLYNVPEELDAPGEFWLDRSTGLLYVYPYSDSDDIEVSLSEKPLISGHADNLTIEGFSLSCTRDNAVELTGNGNSISGLYISCVSGFGISVSGSDNTVSRCEITKTGRGGITVSGGDRKTLTSGNNRITDCYIHDFSEVYQTYQPGISLQGVGNRADHNEISGSPHMAIGYGGNDNIIEYNYIHDVVLHSSDAGAIYAGYDWLAYGNIIRFNILENIGAGDFNPDGIYWDDGLSGQTAYSNILINVRKNAFLVGGGNHCTVSDNIIIGESMSPISYDDRNRDGFVNGGWAHASCDRPDSPHWTHLKDYPFREGIWAEKYPMCAAYVEDFNDFDNPDFPVNPAGSVVGNNIIINKDARFGWVADSVRRYSEVSGNRLFHSCEEAGLDAETLKFIEKPVGFPEIPVDSIGRITK